MNNGTLPSKFLHAVDTWPNPSAQMFRSATGWQQISSAEFLRRIAGLSQAFVELGVKRATALGSLLRIVPNGIQQTLRSPAQAA